MGEGGRVLVRRARIFDHSFATCTFQTGTPATQQGPRDRYTTDPSHHTSSENGTAMHLLVSSSEQISHVPCGLVEKEGLETWLGKLGPVSTQQFVCLFVFNCVGMLLQHVMASLPGGPQTDKEKKNKINKQTKKTTNIHKSLQKNNDTIQNKKQKDYDYVLYNTQ